MSFEFEEDPEIGFAEAATEGEYGGFGADFFTEEDFKSIGVDPVTPTAAKPGSQGKVLMLAARYAAGLPLWHDEDCYDHGPGSPRVSV